MVITRIAIRLKTDFFLKVFTITNHLPKVFWGCYWAKTVFSLPLLTGHLGEQRGSGAAGFRAPERRGTWLTFVRRLWAQFSGAAEDAAAEQDEDGEVTIHVAGAPGSERSISPRSMPLM